MKLRHDGHLVAGWLLRAATRLIRMPPRPQEHNHSTDYGKITDSSLNAPTGPISLEHCLKPHLPKEQS